MEQSNTAQALSSRKSIEYYEFPNGTIVKSIPSNGVYRYDPVQRLWELDPSLTAQFAWDRAYGEPCKFLRKKADIRCDLPVFPSEEEFYPGNTVLIGAYPQRSIHDYSPIEWIVLAADGTTALCISKHGLITSGYCDPLQAYGKPELLWWKNSLARDVCNHHFFDTAFSEEDQSRIIPRKMTRVQLGEKTVDSVFLLSEPEAMHYFPEAALRKAKPTPYAVQTGAVLGWSEDTKENCGWWLLPEENAYAMQDGSIYPKAVFPTGDTQFHGRNIYHRDFTIRPCIQINYRNN